jgi:hypothetical protein
MTTALDRVSRRLGPHDDRQGAMGSVRPSRRTTSGFGAVRRVERSMALRVAVIGVHGQCGEPVARTAPSRHASDIDRRESPDVGQRGIGGPPKASGSTGSTTGGSSTSSAGSHPPSSNIASTVNISAREAETHATEPAGNPGRFSGLWAGDLAPGRWLEWLYGLRRGLVRAQAERTSRSALR